MVTITVYIYCIFILWFSGLEAHPPRIWQLTKQLLRTLWTGQMSECVFEGAHNNCTVFRCESTCNPRRMAELAACSPRGMNGHHVDPGLPENSGIPCLAFMNHGSRLQATNIWEFGCSCCHLKQRDMFWMFNIFLGNDTTRIGKWGDPISINDMLQEFECWLKTKISGCCRTPGACCFMFWIGWRNGQSDVIANEEHPIAPL